MTKLSATLTVVATAVAVGATIVGVRAVNATASVSINQKLTGTAHAPRARGQARLLLKTGASGTFSVKGRHLAAGKTFEVLVNKIKIGTLTTNAGGRGTAKFSTSPKGRVARLGVDPQGGEVEVRDDQGDDVLDGQMPDDNTDSAIGCCLQDDDGESECEDLTAAECTSEGGTPTTATSCLPNPCATTPPPPNSVCCLAHSATGAFVDDDPEVECEDDVSPADCAAQGGTMVQAASCDSNPCQPTPPPQIAICCVSDDDGSECDDLTPANCTAAGGTVNTATSCDPDPCGGGGGGGGGDDGGGGSGSDGGGHGTHGGSASGGGDD